MSKAIFFSIPAHGHTNPTLPLVAELVARGETVLYYSTDGFRDKVVATGAGYRAYPFDVTAVADASKNLAILLFTLVDATRLFLEGLLAEVRAEKPDYIIQDSICVWGKYIAAITGIPAVTSISTFAFQERVADLPKTIRFLRQNGWVGLRHIGKAIRCQRALRKKYGLKRQGFIGLMMNEEDLNIVYTSAAFQPHAERFDPEKFKFVGPSMSDRKDDPDTTDYSSQKRPLVYVSMGTVWNDSFRIADIIDALSDTAGTIVVSGEYRGPAVRNGKTVLVKKHINQLEVLKYCDAFVTHGGMNSVSEGIFRGVPLCVHPFQMEQEEVLERVVETGCGVHLKSLAPGEIRRAVEAVIGDPAYARNVARLAESFREAGGYRAAADYILEYGRNKK